MVRFSFSCGVITEKLFFKSKENMDLLKKANLKNEENFDLERENSQLREKCDLQMEKILELEGKLKSKESEMQIFTLELEERNRSSQNMHQQSKFNLH